MEFAAHALQLGMLCGAIAALELEASLGLPLVLPVLVLGYCVHAWLPGAWKLPFFVALSAAAFAGVLGPADALAVGALGGLLFLLCNLRAHIQWRVAGLLACGALLVALRAGWIPALRVPGGGAPESSLVVPLVASMFLFRGAIYLYDEHTQPRPASIWMRVAYFFLLPNVCFLLFPAVDYRTFQRTYYAAPAREIHARGLRWMLRGTLHLLAYRIVHAYLTPAAGDVHDLGGVLMFVCSSYLLYLRISGHFHLVIGMLHLFGFQLPETNHAYLLAHSFSDSWRRTNVYWTEFMKKLVYYPAYMRLRMRGTTFALVAATALVFVATWWLHALQWFFLQGELPLAWDGMFWGVAALLALWSVLADARRASGPAVLAPGAPAAPPRLGAALRYSLRVLGVFATTSLLWSLWSSRSLSEWLGVLKQAAASSPRDWLVLAGVLALLIGAGVLLQLRPGLARAVAAARSGSAGAWARAAACALLLLLGWERASAALGGPIASALAPLRVESSARPGADGEGIAYYDRLIQRDRRVEWAWAGARFDPEDVPTFLRNSIVRPAPGLVEFELPPSQRLEIGGEQHTINSAGMRDREYALRKPPKTWRIAVLGTCVEMGMGVSDAEVWERQVEYQLNQQQSSVSGLNYEILNFSVPAYSLFHHVSQLEGKVAAYEPDVVLLSNHIGSTIKYLIAVSRTRPEFLSELGEAYTRAGIAPGMDDVEVRRRVSGVLEDIELWGLRRFQGACAEVGAIPVWLEVPFFEADGAVEHGMAIRIAQVRSYAERIGFLSIDIRKGVHEPALAEIVIPDMYHLANANGHRLLAARLYRELLARPELLGMR
jgi:D-alanyl-lipoteichoic acid acyltransferase DltB (MBOAT superfamily)